MPISDEIIELEPVKKNRPKFIILIVVAAVMLALAVTFLVMYLVKPNVEEVPKPQAQNISVNTSSLFLDDYDGDTPVYSVSGGNSYAVNAFVTAEAGAEKDVVWRWNDGKAIAKEDSRKADADGICTYTFEVDPDYAAANSGNVLTLTARSAVTSEVFQNIKIRVVDQKTENIILNEYYWTAGGQTGYANSVTSGRFGITGNTLTIADVTRATYNVLFEQKGKKNGNDEYNDISYSSSSDGNKVTANIVSGQNVLSNVAVVRQTSALQHEGLLSFSVQGPGTAEIRLSAGGVNKSLTVKVETTAAHNVIERIYVYDEPVYHYDALHPENNDLEFFETYSAPSANLPASSQKNIILPYTASYTYENIMDHIVLYPLSLQYDSETGKMKEGWERLIELSSDTTKTNPGAVQVKKNNTRIQITTMQLSKGASDCSLLIKDTSANSYGAYASIGVNVVAGSPNGTMSLSRGDNKWTNESEISLGITAAQNDVFTYSINYTILADAKTDVADFIGKNYLYGKYKVEFDEDDIIVKLGEKTLISEEEYTLGNEFKVTQNETTKSFVGTLDLTVIIAADPAEGPHTVKFTRIGSPFGTVADPGWEKIAKFNVTQQSDYIDFAAENVITSKITNGGEYAGSFKINTRPTAENDFTGAMDIFIQHKTYNSALWFDFEDLVYVNGGTATKSVTCLANTPGGPTILPLSVNSGKFVFTASTGYTNGYCRAEITVKNDNSTQQLGKLTVNVYVIDAYKEMRPDASKETKYYSAVDYSDAMTAEFTVNKEFDERFNTYEYTKIGDVDLAYVKGGEVPLKGAWNNDHTEKSFTLDGDDTVLFKYNPSLGIIPQVDLFSYSYNNGVDIHTVKATYTMGKSADDYFVNDAPLSSNKTFTFMRKADDVKLYSDRTYANDSEIIPTGSSFAHGVNNGDFATLFITPVINVLSDNKTTANSTPVIVLKEINEGSANIYNGSYVPVYIRVDQNSSDALHQAVEADDYVSVSFRAPMLQSNELIVNFGVILNNAVSDLQINLTVENYSRSANSIRFLDENNNEINLLQFGHTKDEPSGKYYEKTVKIEITYDARDDKYTKFEAVTVELPYFIKARFIGGNWQYDSIKLIPQSISYNDAAIVEVIEVIFALDGDQVNPADTVKSDLHDWDDKISFAGIKVTKELAFESRTSVSDVWYTKYDKENKPIVDDDEWNTTKSNNEVDLVFNLQDSDGTIDSNEAEAAAQTLRFRYVTYASGVDGFATWVDTGADGVGYYVSGLIYDKEAMKLDIFDKTTTRVDIKSDGYVGPLKWNSNKNTRIVTITPNNEYLRVGYNTYTYELVFTDTSCAEGDFVGRQFTLTVKVTVNVKYDVYEIGQQSGSYSFTTKGEKGNDGYVWQTADINVVLNDADTCPAMSQEVVAAVSVSLVQKVGDNYVPYSADGISIGIGRLTYNNNIITGYTLRLRDDVTSLQNVYVLAKYGDKTSYSSVIIDTQLLGVRFNADNCSLAAGSTFDAANNTANLRIASSGDVNKLVAEVYNLGTNAADSLKSVTYKLYSNSECTAEITRGVTVNTLGEIVFTDPTQIVGYGKTETFVGVMYLKASYNTVSYVVTVNYSIAPASVTLDNLDESVFANDVFTLYYSAGGYTYVNLNGCVYVTDVFGNLYPASDARIEVSGSSPAVKVESNSAIIPLKTGEAQITVTSRNVSKQYKVEVKSVGALELGNNSATLNVVNGNTTAVNATVNVPNGLQISGQYDFALNGNSNCISVGIDNYTANITVNRDALTSDDYKIYTFTASVVYVPVNSAEKVCAQGSITLSKQFTLTLNGSYKPTVGVTNGTYGLSSPAEIRKSDGGTYKVVIGNKLDGATYSATISAQNIISIGQFNENGEAAITFGNANGSVEFKIVATIYGRAYESESFVLNVSAGGSIRDSFVDSNNRDVETGEVDIDHSATTQPKFKYTIDASNLGGGTISPSDVKVFYTGDVEATTLTRVSGSTNKFEIEFTVNKPTSFTVFATVKANGIVYETPEKSYNFTAVSPSFALSVDKNEIQSGESAVVSVTKNSGEMLRFDVEYSVIGDSTAAAIAQNGNNCTVTAKAITAEKHIIVRATVTVVGGAYDGAVYTYDIDVLLKPVPMPELTWSNVTSDMLEVNDSRYLTGMLLLGGSANITNDAIVTYDVLVNGGVYNNNTVYSLSDDGRLTVNENSVFSAGGTIKVTAKAKLISGVNAGRIVEASYTFRVKPTATVTVPDNGVSGKKGEQAIPATVNLNSGTEDYQLHVGDSYVVVYSLQSDTPDVSLVGNTLVFNSHVTSASQLNMTAHITITSGVYNGCVIIAPFTVNVDPVTLVQVTFSYEGYSEVTTQIKDEKYVLPAEPTREGYSFDGWYTSTDYTSAVTDQTTVENDVAHEIYAKWTQITYTVTFKSEDSTIRTATIAHGSAIGSDNLDAPEEREGYTFGGWQDENDGTIYGAQTKITSDVTLIAIWSINKYTVVLDANGGSLPDGVEAINMCEYNHAYDLPTEEPTREGYTFDGWYNKNDKIIGTSITVTEDVVLTAHWIEIEYVTVVYYLDGGSMSAQTIVKVQNNTEYTLISEIPTREGYEFAGWYNGANKITDRLTVNGNVILTAHWNANDVTVSFVLGYEGDGVTNPESVTVGYNTALEEKFPSVTRTGYTLVGWEDSNGTIYSARTKITSDVTLTAIWRINTYTLVFDANGGRLPNGISILNTSCTYGTAYELPKNPTRDGYKFVGWYNGENEITDTSITVTEDVVLTAHWTAIEYVTVVFYLDGGSMSAPTIVKVEKGTEFTLPTEIPTRDGYTFAGWYNGDDEIDGTEITVNGDVILTAHWTQNSEPDLEPDLDGENELGND